MVRNRSWPAVSHYHSHQRPQVEANGWYVYDLKFHGFAIQLNGSDFLVGLVSHLGLVIRSGFWKRHTKSTPIVEI